MECDLDALARNNLTDKIRTNFIKVDGVFLPEEYKLFADAVENFQVYDDDVYVCSFQKSGTTWTQEMVWCIANDLNFDYAKKVQINERYPYLEFSGVVASARVALRNPELKMPEFIINSVKFCEKLPRPRFIKIHLPYNLLPRQIRTGERKPKIVYAARNPKDVCVSFYHHSKLFDGYCGTFDEFCRLFLGDKVVYAPYWNHVGGFWQRRNAENILFIKYEDMKKDLPSVMRKTASFLNKSLDNKQLAALADHLSFANMKNNPALNREMIIQSMKNNKWLGDYKVEGEFIRSGQIGQWKGTMDDEMIDKFDEWTKENLKSYNGLSF